MSYIEQQTPKFNEANVIESSANIKVYEALKQRQEQLQRRLIALKNKLPKDQAFSTNNDHKEKTKPNKDVLQEITQIEEELNDIKNIISLSEKKVLILPISTPSKRQVDYGNDMPQKRDLDWADSEGGPLLSRNQLLLGGALGVGGTLLAGGGVADNAEVRYLDEKGDWVGSQSNTIESSIFGNENLQQSTQYPQELPFFVIDNDVLAGLQSQEELQNLLRSISDEASKNGKIISEIPLTVEEFNLLTKPESRSFSDEIKALLSGAYEYSPENLNIKVYAYSNENGQSTMVVPVLEVVGDFQFGQVNMPKGSKITIKVMTEENTYMWIKPNPIFEGKGAIQPLVVDQTILDFLNGKQYSIPINFDELKDGDIVFAEISPEGNLAALVLNETAVSFMEYRLPAKYDANIRLAPTTEADSPGTVKENRYVTQDRVSLDTVKNSEVFSQYSDRINVDEQGRIFFSDGNFTWYMVEATGGIEINGIEVGWVRNDVSGDGEFEAAATGTAVPQFVEVAIEEGNSSVGSENLTAEQQEIYNFEYAKLPPEVQSRPEITYNFEEEFFTWQENGKVMKFREGLGIDLREGVTEELFLIELNNDRKTQFIFEGSVLYNEKLIPKNLDQGKFTEFILKKYPFVNDLDTIRVVVPAQYVEGTSVPGTDFRVDTDDWFAYWVIDDKTESNNNEIATVAIATHREDKAAYTDSSYYYNAVGRNITMSTFMALERLKAGSDSRTLYNEMGETYLEAYEIFEGDFILAQEN